VIDTALHYGSKIGASILERTSLQWITFAVLAGATDAATIVLMSIGTGILYHHFIYHDPGQLASYVQIGLMTALLYLLPYFYRSEYLVTNYLEFKKHPFRIAAIGVLLSSA
jgi:polysaccharide biosynthesis protein PslA